ncbi:MAG TPA: hypothetical protein VK437_06740 [Steroidobacteraceae bacterium]|nr:hypothetical protein [Steroidobacteraceae bacterium]
MLKFLGAVVATLMLANVVLADPPHHAHHHKHHHHHHHRTHHPVNH